MQTKHFFVPVQLFVFIISFFVPVFLTAQQKVIHLYDGAAPGSENWTWGEQETTIKAMNTKVAYNVSHPTLTVYLPDSAANGTAVIICPGGAFHILMVEYEGINVAKELNKKGITVFVLRYRLVHSLTDDPVQEMMTSMNSGSKFASEVTPVINLASEDTKAAIAFLRQHAADYHLNAKRIGLLGFSAGGTLTANIAYNYTSATRPDFVALIYAYTESLAKSAVQQDAPPMFIAAASDDNMVPVSNSLGPYSDWLASKHSVEIHLYAKGDHGLRGFPADSWVKRFEEWLGMQGLLMP